MLVAHARPTRVVRTLLAPSLSALPPATARAGVTRLGDRAPRGGAERPGVRRGRALREAGRHACTSRSIRARRRTPASWTWRSRRATREGLVEFSADFYLLKPVDPGRGQRPAVLRSRQSRHQAHPAGVPERRRLRRSDDRRGVRQRRVDAPGLHAAVDGMAVGRAGRPHADGRSRSPPTAAGRSPGWSAATSSPAPTPRVRGHRRSRPPGRTRSSIPSSADHVMYVRTLPTGSRRRSSRARGGASPAPDTVTLDGGFEAGRIYDVVYRARDPRVVGVGLAGTRDLVSFFKHAHRRRGQPEPGHPLRDRLGRVADRPLPPPLRLRGLQRGRAGRIVFDGVFDQVGGAGRGSFNHRFGQQSRDQLQHFNIQYPVDMFPFTDEEQTDPVTGAPRRAARAGAAQQHRAEVLPPADQLRVLQPRRLAGAHRRHGHARRRRRPPRAASTWSRRRRTSSARSRPAPFGDKDFVGQAT